MRAVVFDWDGLMIDSEYTLAVAMIEVLASRGITVTLDELGPLFGSTDNDAEWDAFLGARSGGAITIDEVDAVLAQALPATTDALPLLPGAMEAIEAVARSGRLLGMATGQRRDRLDQHFARLALGGRFAAVVTRGDVGRGKPAPDPYLRVAELLEVHPSECLAVEDSVHGCTAALDAGMAVVVCPSRVTVRCVFPPAARRIGSLHDLGPLLAQLDPAPIGR